MNSEVIQLKLFDQDLWSGKTSPELSAPTKVKILELCLKKQPKSFSQTPLFLNLQKENGAQAAVSWEEGGALLGEFATHSFGECPSVAVVSRLSQILEEAPHPKYFLSAKACAGILRRAEKRGRKLPQQLESVLQYQALIFEQAVKREV